MAVSINYVARETATNLRRNIAMTIAAVLTVAVSLTLVGGASLEAASFLRIAAAAAGS